MKVHVSAIADLVMLTADPGDGLGRPGRLIVELTIAGGRATRVRLGGRALTVLPRTNQRSFRGWIRRFGSWVVPRNSAHAGD